MPSGPSKEQLEVYWTSSRQYFDELAKHYQTADPAYYKEYILPFYANPFRSAGDRKSSGGPRVAIFAVMALVVLIGAAGAVFFVFMSSSSTDDSKIKEKRIDPSTNRNTETATDNKNEKPVEKTEEVEPTPINPKGEDGLTPEDNFIIGSKAISDKDYDKAEKHLKKIKPGQKYYKEAQQLLENMDLLRKFDK